MSTFYSLPDVGASLKVVTHLVVREDAHLLYAFSTESERGLFRALLKVSGIGARIALGILSSLTVEGFHDCVRAKDLGTLTKIPGVGKKTAERLLVEMADRLPEPALDVATSARPAVTAESEAQGALIALGYKPAEVIKMLRPFDAASMTTEALIREALRRVHAS